MEELKALAEQWKAVAVVIHDARLTPFANKIIYVSDGKVSGTPIEDEITHN